MSDGLSAAQRMRLRGLLAAHCAANDVEAGHLEVIGRFVAAYGDPFDSQLSAGHLTGSAFVIDSDWRVLLTHHRKLDLWLQLGGHADSERDASQVAMREAREESGLTDLTFHPALIDEVEGPRLLDVDVHRIPARVNSPEHFHHDLRFLLVAERPEDAVRSEAESLDLEWVSLEECRRRCDAGICRVVDKIQALRSNSGSLMPTGEGDRCALN